MLESTNLITIENRTIPDALERALFVRSLESSLGVELMRKVGWWDKPVSELVTAVIADDKAKRSSEARIVSRDTYP